LTNRAKASPRAKEAASDPQQFTGFPQAVLADNPIHGDVSHVELAGMPEQKRAIH